jgi:transposase InsO family protein
VRFFLPFHPGQRYAGLEQWGALADEQARRGGIQVVLDETDGTDGSAHRGTGQQPREPLIPPTEEVSDRARPPSSRLGRRKCDVDDVHDGDVCVVDGHRGAFGTLEQEKSQSEAVTLVYSVICYGERVNHGAEVSVATPAGMQAVPLRGWLITIARHAAAKQSWTTRVARADVGAEAGSSGDEAQERAMETFTGAAGIVLRAAQFRAD